MLAPPDHTRRLGEQARGQGHRQQPLGFGQTKDHAQVVFGVAPRRRTDGPALRGQRLEVGLQRRLPRVSLPTGGVHGALLQAGMAEGGRQVAQGCFDVFGPARG
jgi:hypothetical protein